MALAATDRQGRGMSAGEDRLSCPRCGYDLTPAMLAAAARGDAHGTCSECGLGFEWARLRDEGGDPRWFVESRGGTMPTRPRLVRALTTLARCVRPFHFWSRIHMAIPTDARGIAAFMLAVAAALHLLFAARNLHMLATIGGGWRRAPTALGWVQTADRNPLDYLSTTLVPLSGVTVSDADKWMREHQAGSDRIGTGAHAWRVAVAVVQDAGLWPPAWIGPRRANPDIPLHSTMLRECNFAVKNRTALRRVACTAVLPLGAPVAILLLPVSMRRARVRARHVWRCTAYSAALLVPCAALFLLSPSGFGASGAVRATDVLELHALLLCAIPLTLAWNWAFVRNYLRLEHAGAVAVSNTVVGTLASLLATSLVVGWI